MRILPDSAVWISAAVSHRAYNCQANGGLTELDNLALACWNCNLKKGPNLTGVDPASEQVVRLFHPRRDRWTSHFKTTASSPDMGIEIHGLTPIGRATVRVLGMNEELRPLLRYVLWRESGF